MSIARDTAASAAAGLLATLPMTIAMETMFRELPPEEQHPLPPRKIVDSAAEKAGVSDALEEDERRTLTTVSHFGYGAAAGALYGPFARFAGAGFASGVAYGLAVWTGSYLGWLPAAGILPPASRDAAGRNALMIAAHIVWGGALGALAQTALPSQRSVDGGAVSR